MRRPPNRNVRLEQCVGNGVEPGLGGNSPELTLGDRSRTAATDECDQCHDAHARRLYHQGKGSSRRSLCRSAELAGAPKSSAVMVFPLTNSQVYDNIIHPTLQ